MKKILLAAALLGMTHCLTAQTSTAKKSNVRFGVKAGFNGSKTSNGFGTDASLFKSPAIRGTIYAGAFAQLPLAEKLTLQPELVYSPEGSLQEGKIGNPADNKYVLIFTTKLNYLNIPVMLQYHFNGANGFYLEAGPQLGFLLSSKLVNANPVTGTPSETDLKSNTKGTNFSLCAGLGYNFKNGFGIGARYVAGLSNIRTAAPDMKVNTIQAGVHYLFGW